MSLSLGSLRKYIPSLKKHEDSDDAPVETHIVNADPSDTDKEKKGDSDLDSDTASQEITTKADPDLNPGSLSFEECAYMRIYERVSE